MDSMIFKELIGDTTVFTSAAIITIVVKILLGFIEGLILGIERKIRQQAIGMRTLILICVASTLLMALSIHLGEIYGGDSARLAAQVVSGIGFLGGGAIMRQGLNIRGLTSAATIWGAAALGLAIGAGFYIPSIIALAFFMIALIPLEKIESRYFPQERTKILSLKFDSDKVNLSELHDIIINHGLIILSSDQIQNVQDHRLEIRYSVRCPEETDVISLGNDIEKIGDLIEVKLTINDK